ncbi:MAG: hypothetical protein ACTHJ8_05825 [Mucilaginibacter sp.]
MAQNQESEDYILKECWQLIADGKDRRLALTYAITGESILVVRQQELIESGASVNEFLRVAMGFNIVAAAYTWNDRFEESIRCDNHYILQSSLWPRMATVISPYLEMLMAKQQFTYLDDLFSQDCFRSYFFNHYEAYMSLKNPHYECEKLMEIIPIVNKVRNAGMYI